jgi:glycosyltransferase involved in cell wall biosynthesis
LEQQAGQLGIAGSVIFRGRVSREEIRLAFSRADLFVHGSVIEASGNALLEAMASGLPIVCTDAGGPSEYVEHGVTGFVVPVGDAQAMADKIGRLLSDAALRREMGFQGRRRAELEFKYESMIMATIRLYNSLLEKPAIASGGSNF